MDRVGFGLQVGVPRARGAGTKRRVMVLTDYANPDALVETDWLEEHADDPNLRIIEVDEDTSAYEKGHIRNAIAWNWTTDLHQPVGRDYVNQRGLSELLGKAGV